MRVLTTPILVGAATALTACASNDPDAAGTAAAQAGERRAVYSGEIESDPAVQREWESGLSALEARRRATGEFCAEAERLRETVGRDER